MAQEHHEIHAARAAEKAERRETKVDKQYKHTRTRLYRSPIWSPLVAFGDLKVGGGDLLEGAGSLLSYQYEGCYWLSTTSDAHEGKIYHHNMDLLKSFLRCPTVCQVRLRSQRSSGEKGSVCLRCPGLVSQVPSIASSLAIRSKHGTFDPKKQHVNNAFDIITR